MSGVKSDLVTKLIDFEADEDGITATQTNNNNNHAYEVENCIKPKELQDFLFINQVRQFRIQADEEKEEDKAKAKEREKRKLNSGEDI